MERPSLHHLCAALRQSTDAQALPVLVRLYCLNARRRMSRLRPRDLVYPAMSAQLLVLLLAITIAPKQPLPLVAAGNIIIAALAILPSTQARKSAHAHWVKERTY